MVLKVPLFHVPSVGVGKFWRQNKPIGLRNLISFNDILSSNKGLANLFSSIIGIFDT